MTAHAEGSNACWDLRVWLGIIKVGRDSTFLSILDRNYSYIKDLKLSRNNCFLSLSNIRVGGSRDVQMHGTVGAVSVQTFAFRSGLLCFLRSSQKQ